MRRIPVILAAGALWVGFSAQAEVSDEEFNKLKAQYADLAEKVDGKSDSSWADRIGISGDFRYRYENIDEESKDERNRSRIRARTAIKAALLNDIEVGFGLATGSEDPVSANVTIGGGGSSKEINLDLAYASWTGLSNTVLTGGKFKNPFIRPGGNGLLWDGDWRPEGLTAGWDNGRFFGTAFGTWLDGDSKGGSEFAWGVQGGFKADLSGTTVMIGASYFDIGAEGEQTVFGEPDEFFGNSGTCVDPVTPADCTYDYNYEEVEVFVEVATRIAGQAVKFFADYVQNQDADDNDTGWAAGVKLGKAKDTGKWEAGYLYQDLEADAVFGLLTDSDFGGGGTDNKGHRMYIGYGLNKMAALKATYFINEVNVVSGNPNDYDRLVLDIQFKFK
ncbi:MAG: putative porin [Gammaproteobacteria bacterium]|nr:putative porin [Gammaproteobacteria bacterium]